ncbi:MAG TPA: hypothetical protein VFV08_16855 [Puia sp.]|nr:hypothetical protein [Puia sp.]
MPSDHVSKIAQFLFASARSEDTARTIQEISSETGIALSTCHRLMLPKYRPVGIVIASERRQANTRTALQYWYNIEAVNEAAKEYQNGKLLKSEEILMPDHIPNNSTKIAPKDLVPLYLEPKYKKNFESLIENLDGTDYASIRKQISELFEQLDSAELPNYKKIWNLLNFGLAIAQRGVDLYETD